MTADEALVQLLRLLRHHDYQFTAVTPATHATVLARPPRHPPDLRDVFGWNREFRANDLDRDILRLLDQADAIERADNGELTSWVRVASLGLDLFVHSGFPTEAADSVFFGPDTYRFVNFVKRQLPTLKDVRHVVDMGAGTGCGGIAVARQRPEAKVTLVDVNSSALRLARVNAEVAGVTAEMVTSHQVPKGADLIIANPPYMNDRLARSYRDGGGLHGGAVALDWVDQALLDMRPGSSFLLYTGAAYVDGQSPLLRALQQRCRMARAEMLVEEIDPDVFGDELSEPAYSEVERIAAVGVTIRI